MLAELDPLHRHHFGRLISSTSGLNGFTPDMSYAESKNALCRHPTKAFRTNFFRQQFAMRLERKSLRDLYGRPKFVVRSSADGVGRAEHDMTRERIALKHPVERGVDRSEERRVGKEC